MGITHHSNYIRWMEEARVDFLSQIGWEFAKLEAIIYAEQIFCNYYMDLDYKAYIPEEYLLDGFDATSDNSYRNKMLKEK